MRDLACSSSVSATEIKQHFVDYISQNSGEKDIVVQYVSVCSSDSGRELGDGDVVAKNVMIAAAIQFKGFAIRLIDNIVIV